MNIIELAREADAAHDDVAITPFLERFAHLVRAAALEEAAGVVDDVAKQCFYTEHWQACVGIAAAIRKLKEKT